MDPFVSFALIAAEEAMPDAGLADRNDWNKERCGTKSMTGHLLGASGAIEAVFTTLAVKEGFIPPTINYRIPDDACDLDIVANEGRNIDITH